MTKIPSEDNAKKLSTDAFADKDKDGFKFEILAKNRYISHKTAPIRGQLGVVHWFGFRL